MMMMMMVGVVVMVGVVGVAVDGEGLMVGGLMGV